MRRLVAACGFVALLGAGGLACGDDDGDEVPNVDDSIERGVDELEEGVERGADELEEQTDRLDDDGNG